MALAMHAIRALAPHLKGAKVLSLGYPDIIATKAQVKEVFGVTPLWTNKDGAEWHNANVALVETEDLFKLIGATLECVDVKRWRGIERIVDLNDPQDLGEFDLVIDPGTTEHCFNVGQAIMNAARAVRVGGRIYHSPPLFMLNHGFYNFCPTALQDFYEQNGWKIELYEARMAGSDGPGSPLAGSITFTRNATVKHESGLVFMAQRLNDAPLRWPMQKKYVVMAKQKAVA